MDPLQWMGAIRMRVQTADEKNHSNPQHIHPLTSLKQKWHILISKSIIKRLQLQTAASGYNMNPLSVILLSPVKLFCLNQERNIHKSSPIYKWKQF